MLRMAKKKQKGDRHTSRVLVGIPKELYERVKERAVKNGRPATWELRMLIESGLTAPPPKPASE